MKIIRKYNKSESGQSLIEFALILPVLLVLVMGIIEFGWFIMARVSVNNAAREVARAYVVGTPADVSKGRGVELIKHLTLKGVSKESNESYESVIEISPESPSVGSTITVTITGEIEPLIGFFPVSYSIDTTAYMRMENTP